MFDCISIAKKNCVRHLTLGTQGSESEEALVT